MKFASNSLILSCSNDIVYFLKIQLDFMNGSVDTFIQIAEKWQEEMTALRSLLIECGLSEELKWRQPCYTYKGTNIAIIGAFKESCVLSFFKGALLEDPEKILVFPGENSQSSKVIRFKHVQEIYNLKAIIKAYILEAIEVENIGLKVELKNNTELEFVDELQDVLNSNNAFKQAFESLTPGRQRGYNIYFSTGKQSKTRTSRIEQYMPRILSGKGLNDCTCGLSKKMPSCDGSHKLLKNMK